MTPAQELREAAAQMRERAGKATPGPWRPIVMGSEGARVAPDTGDRREDVRWIANVNGRVMPEDGHNAGHIASWHPDVALAVADWLDFQARLAKDGLLSIPGDDTGHWQGPELAVARAYLGEPSTHGGGAL